MISRPQDIFLDMSFWQAFGRTGLEAMAAGCVPVLPVGSGSEEYATHGVNVMLHNTSDYHDAVRHISFLLDNPAKLIDMQRRALATSTNYDFTSASFKMLNLLCTKILPPNVPVPCRLQCRNQRPDSRVVRSRSCDHSKARQTKKFYDFLLIFWFSVFRFF